jgi:hypothetical protein
MKLSLTNVVILIKFNGIKKFKQAFNNYDFAIICFSILLLKRSNKNYYSQSISTPGIFLQVKVLNKKLFHSNLISYKHNNLAILI